MGSVSWTGSVQIAQTADPSTYVAFPAATVNDSSDGRTNVLVAVDGTKRLFTSAGVPRTFNMTAPFVTRADFATLQGWVGSRVVARDPVGRVVYAALNNVSGGDVPGPDRGVAQVTVQLTEVAGSAEV